MDSESLFSAMNRRDFLKASGTGLAGAILLGTTSGRVLARERTSLKAEFSLAAAKYKVPKELLLAIGYVNTLWEMPPPDASPYEEGDLHGRGTYVAGVAAANTNNGKGIAGGCFRCRLLAAKVLNSTGAGSDSNIVKGIKWSMNNGADVVNLSLGGPKKSAVLKRAVDDAWRRGAVIAAAGNGGTTRPDYPAAYSRVIAVSATDRSDRLAGFSNRGNWVDLAAPGVGILSTAPGGGYARQNGTSLSTPFVSGLAGLLASQQLSAPQIRKRMENTAKDLGPSGRDPYLRVGQDKRRPSRPLVCRLRSRESLAGASALR